MQPWIRWIQRDLTQIQGTLISARWIHHICSFCLHSKPLMCQKKVNVNTWCSAVWTVPSCTNAHTHQYILSSWPSKFISFFSCNSHQQQPLFAIATHTISHFYAISKKKSSIFTLKHLNQSIWVKIRCADGLMQYCICTKTSPKINP